MSGPDLRVVKGEPTDEELAALVAAINVVTARAEGRAGARPSNWSAYWRSVRTPVHPGQDGWLASTRPTSLTRAPDQRSQLTAES